MPFAVRSDANSIDNYVDGRTSCCLVTTHPDLTARQWKRLERRALAGHRKDLITDLGVLAEQSADIRRLEPPRVGLLGLRFSGRLLVLAGVGPQTWREVADLMAERPANLVGAGRYGRMWWITLSDGFHNLVIAGSHLRLTYTDDGHCGKVGVGPCVDASREAT